MSNHVPSGTETPKTANRHHKTVDPTVWGELTGFKRDLLRVLAGLDAPNGLEIEAELTAYYPNLTHARVYQNLDQLADRGLITKRSIDDRQNAYGLTDDGETRLEAAVDRLTDASREVRGHDRRPADARRPRRRPHRRPHPPATD